MLKSQFIFVAQSKGIIEETKKEYNNVKLSDGIRIIKLKNETSKDFRPEDGFIPEKSKVEATLLLKSNKEEATVSLIDLTLVK